MTVSGGVAWVYPNPTAADPLPVSQAGGAALNAVFDDDKVATTVRAITEEDLIARGLHQGRSIVSKFGRNPALSTASVPEDMWNGGGTYTGFPTGAAEEFQVFSSSAGDVGNVIITYLASFTSTAWQQATVAINGTTVVNSGITGVRMHTARFETASATAFNVGEITVRHRTTTTNIFCKIPIGRSQSNVSAYTIPFGSSGRLTRIFATLAGTASAFAEGSLWVREFGKSPRLRRPFSMSSGADWAEEPYGGLMLPALTDVVIRMTSSSANNLTVSGGFDIVLAAGV